MIVPNEQVELARTLAETIVGPAGYGMWTTAVSKTGIHPPSHWISAGLIDPNFAQLLPLITVGEEVVVSPGDAPGMVRLAAEAGLDVSLELIEALLQNSDVSEQDPFAALARLNLKIANPEGE
jgi:hypothetical protein